MLSTQSNNAKVAESLFDAINNSFVYGNNKVRMFIIDDEMWFCGKDVADILEYKNTKKAIENVRSKNKKTLEELLNISKRRPQRPLIGNEKSSIYIDEPGLYALILKSRMEAAEQFQDWIADELLPSIRKLGQEKFMAQLEEQKQLLHEQRQLLLESKEQLEEKDQLLQKKDSQLNRLHEQNIELLSYQMLTTKKVSIYIVSTFDYARQGFFKVGRTKSISGRNTGHNTTHITGDKVRVLAEFKVHSGSIETIIHQKLKGLRLMNDTEFVL